MQVTFLIACSLKLVLPTYTDHKLLAYLRKTGCPHFAVLAYLVLTLTHSDSSCLETCRGAEGSPLHVSLCVAVPVCVCLRVFSDNCSTYLPSAWLPPYTFPEQPSHHRDLQLKLCTKLMREGLARLGAVLVEDCMCTVSMSEQAMLNWVLDKYLRFSWLPCLIRVLFRVHPGPGLSSGQVSRSHVSDTTCLHLVLYHYESLAHHLCH